MTLGTLLAALALLLTIIFFVLGRLDGAIALVVGLTDVAILVGAVGIPGRRVVP